MPDDATESVATHSSRLQSAAINHLHAPVTAFTYVRLLWHLICSQEGQAPSKLAAMQPPTN